jgi:NAD(P)-dependent dehydrogenase (short-subunit alcohol dehydrogenase family)
MGETQRRAIVTGAASGIGQAVARRLLHEGIHVIEADRNEAGLAQAVERGPSRSSGT